MDILNSEVREYLKEFYQDQTFTLSDIQKNIVQYSVFTKSLIPSEVPKELNKYINIPHMIHDLYLNEEILIFRYNIKDDDNDTINSYSEYSAPEHTVGFINGVKIMDDVDIREQITANEYTGGYWDEEIHWVVDLRKLLN